MSARDPVLGDTSLLPRMQRHQVKGTLLGARARYIEQEYGKSVLGEMIERVPPPARRHLIEKPTPFAWYPLAEMVEIDRALLQGPMLGNVAKMREFGNEVARYDLPTIYRVLFKVGSPMFVMKRAGLAYRTYLRGGAVKSERIDDTRVRLLFHEAVYPLYLCTHAMSGWLAASVELSGGKQIVVRHEQCVHQGDSTCVSVVSWQ